MRTLLYKSKSISIESNWEGIKGDYITEIDPVTSPIVVPCVSRVAIFPEHAPCKLITAFGYKPQAVNDQLVILTPDVKPYTKDQTTSPARLFAAIQQKPTIADDPSATIMKLKCPHRSAKIPGRTRPIREAELRMEIK